MWRITVLTISRVQTISTSFQRLSDNQNQINLEELRREEKKEKKAFWAKQRCSELIKVVGKKKPPQETNSKYFLVIDI